MRLASIALLLAALTISACGGDDAGDEAGGGGPATAATEQAEAPPGGGGALEFATVEGFTIEALEAEKSVTEECKELTWRDERGKEADGIEWPGTTAHEILECDTVPYVLYLEYPDAATLEQSLAQAGVPYLRAGSTVVQPGVAMDEAAAAAYLEALRAECGCGEVVDPAA